MQQISTPLERLEPTTSSIRGKPLNELTIILKFLTPKYGELNVLMSNAAANLLRLFPRGRPCIIPKSISTFRTYFHVEITQQNFHFTVLGR